MRRWRRGGEGEKPERAVVREDALLVSCWSVLWSLVLVVGAEAVEVKDW